MIGQERAVRGVFTASRQMVAPAFPIRRGLPAPGLPDADPFLLLDHMGPMQLKPHQAEGVPEHPHRGFQTISYILDGYLEHKDSFGGEDTIGPGDIQWMTAGAGLVHSELFPDQLREEGGPLHGFQIWVNLPKAHKMARPGYELRRSAEIPRWESADGLTSVKVIAGQIGEVAASIDTFTPIQFFHAQLQAGGRVVLPVPVDHTAFVYVATGAGTIGVDGKPIRDGQIIPLGDAGDQVTLSSDSGMDALLLSGVPLREPVVAHGPFVMNSAQEIMEAIEDYRAGKMGQL